MSEDQRLQALRRLGIMDRPPRRALDGLALVARQALRVRIAGVGIVGRTSTRIFHGGSFVDELPRRSSIAASLLGTDRPLVVADASRDGRFAAFPQVRGHPRIRAILAVPVRLAAGPQVGAFVALDPRARIFTADDVATAEAVARLASDVLDAAALRDAVAGLASAVAAERDSAAAILAQADRLLALSRPPAPGAATVEFRTADLELLEALARKWTVPILGALDRAKRLRFTELQRALRTISARTLSNHLKLLVGVGLVERQEDPGPPQRVEYALTPLGVRAAREIVTR